MASAVLQIAGVAIGGALGGPLGASIGGAIGGAIGAAIEGPTQIEGPRLTDLRVMSSSYGATLPLVYGAENRISGNMIASSGLIEKRHKESSGGKGGSETEVKTYTYSVTVAISLGEGPCKNITRIWANSKLLFDIFAIETEVIRLEALAVELEATAVELETACAADPSIEYNCLYAPFARDEANLALANSIAARTAYEQIIIGGIPWALYSGTALPDGNLGYLAFYPGTDDQPVDVKIEELKGAGNTPAYLRTCYVVMGELQLADYGNRVPNFEFELDGLAPRDVGAILQDICQRSGMQDGEYSVHTGLVQMQVRGFAVATNGPSLSAIGPLQAAFSFEAYEQHGTTTFVPRGQMPMATIPDNDLATRNVSDSVPEKYTLERLPDHQLLKSSAITYRDPDRDYQENTQKSSRLRGDAYTELTTQLALTISSDEARRLVDQTLWAAWTDRVPARVTVSDKYSFLKAGNVVIVRMAGAYLPFRVEYKTRGINGLIELELRQEDPFIYDGNTSGQTASIPINEIQLVGNTYISLIDSPYILPFDDDTGFYWFMDADSDGWRGGILYRSVTGETLDQVAESNIRNITGTVASALYSASCDVWDRVNTITVQLKYANHELESFDENEILNGKNAFWLGAEDGSHGEVIQFATATLISNNPKTYQLSNLLRGRRGTEHETVLHGPNETFIAFDVNAMRSLNYGYSDFDKTRFFFGLSIYKTQMDISSYQMFTNTGERKRPRAPVNAIGERDTSNNLTITWTRRVRGYTSGPGYGEVPLDETSESYQVEIIVASVVVRTIAVSTPTASYTAAQQTADGITPGNPVTIQIYQLSSVVGRGHPGVFTV